MVSTKATHYTQKLVDLKFAHDRDHVAIFAIQAAATLSASKCTDANITYFKLRTDR